MQSCHEGTSHLIRHRISLIILMPLTVWALFYLLPQVAHFCCYSKNFSADIRQWVSVPLNGILLLAWFFCVVYHSTLCMQIIIEDYVATLGLRMACIFLLRAFSCGLVGLILLSFYWLYNI